MSTARQKGYCLSISEDCFAQLLEARKSRGRNKDLCCRRHPILIVVPASVIDNWLREFATWGLFAVLAMKSGVSFEARAAMLRQAFDKACEVVIVGVEMFT